MRVRFVTCHSCTVRASLFPAVRRALPRMRLGRKYPIYSRFVRGVDLRCVGNGDSLARILSPLPDFLFCLSVHRSREKRKDALDTIFCDCCVGGRKRNDGIGSLINALAGRQIDR